MTTNNPQGQQRIRDQEQPRSLLSAIGCGKYDRFRSHMTKAHVHDSVKFWLRPYLVPAFFTPLSRKRNLVKSVNCIGTWNKFRRNVSLLDKKTTRDAKVWASILMRLPQQSRLLAVNLLNKTAHDQWMWCIFSIIFNTNKSSFPQFQSPDLNSRWPGVGQMDRRCLRKY